MLIIGNTIEDDDNNDGIEQPQPPEQMKKTASMTRDPQKLVSMALPTTMLKSNSL